MATQLNSADVALPRGRWVELNKGVPSGKGTDTKIQGQFALKVPADVQSISVRFMRVYKDGRRDGTGDLDLFVGHRRGGLFQWTWNHSVGNGPFTWSVEANVPGEGKAMWKYRYAKSYSNG